MLNILPHSIKAGKSRHFPKQDYKTALHNGKKKYAFFSPFPEYGLTQKKEKNSLSGFSIFKALF